MKEKPLYALEYLLAGYWLYIDGDTYRWDPEQQQLQIRQMRYDFSTEPGVQTPFWSNHHELPFYRFLQWAESVSDEQLAAWKYAVDETQLPY